MKTNPQLFALVIAVISILDAAVFTTALAAQIKVTKSPNSTQLITQTSDSFIERTWQAENNKFRVRFFKVNNIYQGKIVWLQPGAETKDVKNLDPNLRSRNLIGLVVFDGFIYNPSQKQWTGGTLYAADFGGNVKPMLSIAGTDRLNVQVQIGIFSKTMTLTAVK